jgi:poly-gamma-glutamate system protein
MGVDPLLISSLGASQWGASDPGFNWLTMIRCLRQSGVLDFQPIALSLGGEGDEGKDMSPEGRAFLAVAAKASGYILLDEPDLERNVAERLRLYQAAAGRAPIKAFINIGGGYANLGTDSEILKVKPGLAEFSHLPPAERRGMIFAMAARGVPVIHLLYVRGLCDHYGLPWDPRPLPEPGMGPIYSRKELNPRPFWIAASAYFAVVLAVLFLGRNRLGGRTGQD